MTRAERERVGPPPRGHGLLGIIARETHPVRVHDVNTDSRRYGFPPHHPEMHSLLGVPVSAKGRSIGRLYLTNKLPSGDFTEDDERLVEMFALHAGIAIENARLHEQVQRLAIVEERERIGRDLHDGIIQSIYAVGLSLEDVPDLFDDEPDVARARVERAIDSLDQSIRDIRNFIFGLRPELLEQAGLIGGLVALADEFRVNSMVDIDLDTAVMDESELSADVIGQLLSIAREALSNIARHSKATQGSVHVELQPEQLILAIADNGVGFDQSKPRGVGHQGLVNMSARASSMGGRFEVHSEPSLGTRIIVSVPRRAQSGGVADRGDE
jgi:signal transduction histidine kinase